MAKIYRKCLVCGKRLTIVLYEDGYYRGGHFFNTIEIPVGEGEYRKVKECRVGGKKYDVVKWTGKKKKLEYWECNSCYEKAQHECWLENMIEKFFGTRCADFDKDCPCCQAWFVYDVIVGE